MSDWRDDDTEEPNRKTAAGKPAKAEKKRKRSTSNVEADWRESAGAASRPSSKSAGVEGRRWLDADEIFDEHGQPGGLTRWLNIGLASTIAVILTVVLIAILLPKPPLIVRVLSSGKSQSPELGTVPFSTDLNEGLRKNVDNNVAFEIKDEPGYDSSLASLFKEDGFASQSDDENAKKSLAQKFVPFYISCFATIRDEHIFLYSQDKNPFGKDETGLKLSTLLTKLASSVSEGAKAWIILDVQLPPITSNICDLAPAWENATKKALDEITEKSLSDRVIVTLPCGNYQQNALSPEYASSFFGHTLRRLLTDYKGEGLLEYNLTFGEFLKKLNSRVTNEVGNRRYALQEPKTLPEAAVGQVGAFKLVRITGRSQTSESPSYNKERLEERLKKVRGLYVDLTKKHRDAYRWDPIGYAIAEQELQRLEQAAIEQPESFDEISKRVNDAMGAIRKPDVNGFGVSVIEDAMRQEYFSDQNFDEVDRAVKEYLALLREPPTKNAEGETVETGEKKPVPGQNLEGLRRALFEWRLWVEIAKKPTNEMPSHWFSRKNLLTRIEEVGTADGTWVEFNFLRILAQDIDWGQGSSVDVKLIANAILLFDRVQKLGSTPEPEITWFLRSQLAPAEKAFLQGTDWLLVGNWSKARVAFDQTELQLNELEPVARDLQDSLNATRAALHLLPNLVKWQLSEYVFASNLQNIEDELKKLAGVANLASQFYEALSKDALSRQDKDPNAQLLDFGKKLKNDSERIFDLIVKKVNKPAASDNAETFRHDMLALSIPVLSDNQRKQIHERILGFLDVHAKQIANSTEPFEDIGEGATLPECRNAAVGARSFLNALKFDKEMWTSILSREMRFHFREFEESYLASKDFEPKLGPRNLLDANVLDLRSKLLKLEYPLRIMAFVIGSGPSIRKQLSSIDPARDAPDARLTHWPLAAAWQRWNLAAVYQRKWQVERLCEQAWGDRAYTKDTPTKDFYFASLAQKYLDIAIPADLKLELGDGLKKQGTEFLEQRANTLKQLDPKIDDLDEKAQFVRAKLEFSGGKTTSWEAVANFVLQLPLKRTPGTPWELGPSKVNRFETEATYDASLWGNSTKPIGKLAVRGNYLSTPPVAWLPKSAVKLVHELKLQRPIVNKATVTVLPPSTPPRINVWMLIDCSASMNTTMEWVDEKDGNTKTMQTFEAVRNNANRILEKFGEMHKRLEANVHFGVIAFGLTRTDDTSQDPQLFTVALKQSNLKSIAPNISETPIRLLDDNWNANLISCIEKLCADDDTKIDQNKKMWPAQWARSNTPLFNAINHACTSLIPLNSEQAFIYVLGDGVNNNEGKPSKSADDIEEKLRKINKLRLSFFLFDNYEKWIANKKPADLSKEGAKEMYEKFKVDEANNHKNGLRDLEKMQRALTPKKFEYNGSRDVNVLLSASLNSVPKLKLNIHNETEPRFTLPNGTQLGEKVEIGPTYLPSVFTVTVGDVLDESRQAEFRLQGGEELSLAAEDLRDVQLPPDSNSGRPSTPIGGKLDGNIILKTGFGAQRLTFDLQFWNGRRKGEVTLRPEFILAEATDPEDDKRSSILVADYNYAGYKFPEAQSISIPWQAQQSLRLRIWAADSRPAAVQEILLDTHTKDKQNEGEAIVEYARKAERIEVQVRYKNPPQPSQRLVVLCPRFQEVIRRCYSDNHEEHSFVLPAALQGKTVPLWITSVQALEASARKPAPDCKEFSFPSFRPVGN